MHGLPLFVSVGEALTDMVRGSGQIWTANVGGAGFNVARAMAGLGISSAFAGAISNDVFGLAIQASAQEARLDPRFLQLSDHPPLLAIVHETAPPDYFFIGENSADLQFCPADLPQGWEKAASWVHFGGISLARRPLADALLALAVQIKQCGVRISYDPNYRKLMDHKYDRMLHKMAALADVIKVSDEDLQGLFRTRDTAWALQRLRELNPAADILLTRGAEGAELHRGTEVWHALPPAVELADTIGAGDASICGLLYSMMQCPDLSAAHHLRFSVAAGTAACTRYGATPPQLVQIRSLYSSVQINRMNM